MNSPITELRAGALCREYESEYRGVVQYYWLAINLHRFSRLRWVMEQSLTKPLAAKLRISGKQVRKRYTSRIQPKRGHDADRSRSPTQ